MNLTRSEIKSALPYVFLATALTLCGLAFLRCELYRKASELNFSQTYEVQWRTTQIREYLTRIHGDLRLADATGELDTDLGRQIFLLSANVGQLLSLEYVPKFLRERDMELLQELNAKVQAHINPIAEGSTEFATALTVLPELKQRMFEISGTAVAHAATLNEAAHVAAATSRNHFLLAVALTLAAVGYALTHLRIVYARRRDQHLRSFSSLYAHMTRSRVTALRLFLGYQDESTVQHPDMLVAAKEAVQQLEAITIGLSNIAYAEEDPRREQLSEVLCEIVSSDTVQIDLDIDPEAAAVEVPSTQMRLIHDELVRNAENAVENGSKGRISIVARLRRNLFGRRRQLFIEVRDNGQGMPREVLLNAKTPFFSTKAGSHTGLGLTGCAQMVAALRGRLEISSEPNRGTFIEITVPVLA